MGKKNLGDPKLYSIFSLLVIITVLLTSEKHRSPVEQCYGKGLRVKGKVVDPTETVKRYLL